MKKTCTRCLGGLIIVLLMMSAGVGAAYADEPRQPIDILAEIEKSVDKKANESDYMSVVEAGISPAAKKVVDAAKDKSPAYRKAFREEFNRCMKEAESKSQEVPEACAVLADDAGKAASFTETGGLPDDFFGGSPSGSIDPHL